MGSRHRSWILALLALVLVSRAASPQGNPLGTEFRVNTTTFGDQYAASIAPDASGNMVVVWTSWGQDGPDYAITGQRYDSSGVPLGPEFRVNTYTTDHQNRPSILVDASGAFVVVWGSREQDGSEVGIYGQRYSSSGASLGPEFQVNTYTTGLQFLPSIAAIHGGFVVVWTSRDQDGSGDGVFGQRYTDSGVPQDTEFRANAYTTGYQSDPALAATPDGEVVMVWADSYGEYGQGIVAQRYAGSGAPIGPQFHVNTYTFANQRFPSVAADPSGNFVVVWQSDTQDGSSYGIFGQRYSSAGAPLGPEFRVNTYTTGMQFWPRVAADAAGDFVVVWSSYEDGSTTGVFGQRYASSGAPLGPEFRVNTYTTSYQTLAVAAADAAGKFVVLWTSAGQDGSAFGVFAQRYGPIVPVALTDFQVD